jgi:hypothetical protein
MSEGNLFRLRSHFNLGPSDRRRRGHSLPPPVEIAPSRSGERSLAVLGKPSPTLELSSIDGGHQMLFHNDRPPEPERRPRSDQHPFIASGIERRDTQP